MEILLKHLGKNKHSSIASHSKRRQLNDCQRGGVLFLHPLCHQTQLLKQVKLVKASQCSGSLNGLLLYDFVSFYTNFSN